ncbi:recombinase family protein [Pseudorhodoplanes sp.]|uniref:recombinase family protein n=1 Tax=Pseudorhodoplanes sp. TaxID=1934341 RepID=UPI003D0B709D
MKRSASKTTGAKVLRCAVYTRKSTEHGLELEFNSLDAQREACEAYIKSQASEGWVCLPKQYDDPAFSGGNLERPALKRLLKDIEAGLIDVVVVYKIDRLTRSLSDFARLVDIFDAHSISFVAITQQFNTTTSMGRLTLNILLSFAQFERELASERVRDKVAASRRKGKWMGGTVPLGYDAKDKKLVINQTEAKIVRTVFERYVALKSVPRLIAELDRKGIVTKAHQLKGKVIGGIPFNYGTALHVLKNRIYLGETGHDGKWFAGEHEPILDHETFDRVQEIMKGNAVKRSKRRTESGALLTGFLYDDRGNRMSPTYAIKKGVRYPFYVSTALLKGRKNQAGTISRISATEIETTTITMLRKHAQNARDDSALPPREMIEHLVYRIVIRSSKVVIELKKAASQDSPSSLEIAWPGPTKGGSSEAIEPAERCAAGTGPGQSKPELVQAVVRAHLWFKQLQDGTYGSIEELGRAVKMHPKSIRSELRLAFLAPKIIAGIVRGNHRRTTSQELDQAAGSPAWKV